MSMTRRERLGKQEIIRKMSEEGYPTYAELFSLFDLNLTKDPDVIGFMVPEKAIIVINENLDIDQASVVVRHEVLHEFLEHMSRLKALGDEMSQTANIAADYEISNLGYTDKDKSAIRNLKVGDRVLSGLVTELDYPGWENLSFEEMYKRLKEKLKSESPESGKTPQIGDRGNSQIQEAEEIERRAQQIREQAEDAKSQAEQELGDGSSGGQDDESSSSSGSSGNSQNNEAGQDGEGGSDVGDTSGGDDPGEDSGSGESGGGKKGNRNRYDDEEYKNMSPEEKKRERARRRREAAKRLKEEADKLIDEIDEAMGNNDSSGNSESGGPGENSGEKVFDTPEEQEEREKKIAKIKEFLGKLEKKASIIDESQNPVIRERASKAARDSGRYRDSALTRFTESLNRFIRDSIGRSRNSSWAHINKKYVNSGLLKPGSTYSARGEVPLINVYFDRSGSWDAKKTEKGRQAISTLNKYVTRGEIVLKLYYFNTKVLDTDPGGNGGTNGQPILDHIQQTKPNNVIILTDSDIRDCRTTVQIPGAVWFLWYDGRSGNLATHLSGRQLTKEFVI